MNNRLGLHARPAARFVGALAGIDARVEVANESRGRGPADGRSLTGLATLAVRQGDEIVVTASGGGAADALAAVGALASENFGDAEEDDVPAAAARGADAPAAAPRPDSPAAAEPASPPRPGTRLTRRSGLGGDRDRARAASCGRAEPPVEDGPGGTPGRRAGAARCGSRGGPRRPRRRHARR